MKAFLLTMTLQLNASIS